MFMANDDGTYTLAPRYNIGDLVEYDSGAGFHWGRISGIVFETSAARTPCMTYKINGSEVRAAQITAILKREEVNANTEQ